MPNFNDLNQGSYLNNNQIPNVNFNQDPNDDEL